MPRTIPILGLSLLIFLMMGMSGKAGAAEPIRIASVEPARTDSLLVCILRTVGLPDVPSRETLESGLPSSIVLRYTLLDHDGEEIADAQTEIRIEPDLWEEVILLKTPLFDRRLSSIGELASELEQFGPLPVLPLPNRALGNSMQLRVRLAVHPLARTQIRKVHSLFGRSERQEGEDRREVSIGLGALVRFFLGREEGEDWIADAISMPFSVTGLEKISGRDNP